MSANHYEILGVSPEASDDEIRKAYYHLAREFHPDKASSPEEAVAFDERMGIVSAAYNELKDRGRRALYDKALFGTGTRNSSETQQEPAVTSPANPELAPPPPPSVPAKTFLCKGDVFDAEWQSCEGCDVFRGGDSEQ